MIEADPLSRPSKRPHHPNRMSRGKQYNVPANRQQCWSLRPNLSKSRPRQKRRIRPPQAATSPAATVTNTAEFEEVKLKIEIVPQIAHQYLLSTVAFSPDGTRVLSGGADKTVKLWDVATGALLRTFVGHTGARQIGRVLARRHPRAVGQHRQDDKAVGREPPASCCAPSRGTRPRSIPLRSRPTAPACCRAAATDGEAVGRGYGRAAAHFRGTRTGQLGCVLARWHAGAVG